MVVGQRAQLRKVADVTRRRVRPGRSGKRLERCRKDLGGEGDHSVDEEEVRGVEVGEER